MVNNENITLHNETREVHDYAIIIDALQASNWDRELFEELKKGGLSCVHVTCSFWENARSTIEKVSKWYRIIRENSDILMLVKKGEDIETAKATSKVGIILGFQNASPIEDDLGLVEIFHTLGVRIMQLTYNNQNLIGGGCYEDHDSGLSRYGRLVIQEMNRLGILIDLSHVGEKSTLETIEVSSRPVSITHSFPYDFNPSRRNKKLDVLRALSKSGGVMGISIYPHLIGGSDVTLDQFCEVIARMVDIMGVEHVGIGSDSVRKCTDDYLMWMRMGRWTHSADYGAGSADSPSWPEWPSWFKSPVDFYNITSGLLNKGFSKSEVTAILGGNWLRLFKESF
jgi:membrane dipeptidase